MTFKRVEAHSSTTVRDRTAARWRVALGVAGPAVLAALLPAPGRLLAQVGDGSDAVGVLGAAMVLAVTAVVWGLLAWAVLVGIATVLTRMPGAAGRIGRVLLRAIAPAAARRILIVATGVSLVAGASACGTNAGVGMASAGGGPAVTMMAVTMTTEPVSTEPVTTPGSSAPLSTTTTGPAYRDGGYAGPGATSSTADAPATSGGTASAVATPPSRPLPRITLEWPLSATADASGRQGRTPSAAADPPTAHPPTADPPTTDPSAADPPTAHPSSAQPSEAQVSEAAGANRSAASPAPASAPVSPAMPHTATPPAPAGSTGTHPSAMGAAPRTGGPTAAGAGATETAHAAPTVLVRPGDSLWVIAARRLPADATDAQIDAAWRAWYSTNRAVIGGDPDLIMPGEQLAPPNPAAPRTAGGSS